MLQAAAEIDRPVDDVEEDRVHVVRRFAHDPVLDRRHLGDPIAEIARHRRRVIGCGPHRDANPLPIGLERIDAIAADERHRIRELVVISGPIDSVGGTFERGRHLPSRR